MTRTYKIPYRLIGGASAKNKAKIAYVSNLIDDGHFVLHPERDSALLTIRADSIEEAYRQMCLEIRPNDGRPILGKWAVRFFVVGELVVGHREALPEFEEFS